MEYSDGRFLPVFPLPDTVLYPGILLPLHVFEPRYRLMLAEVLDTYGKLAVALLEPASRQSKKEEQPQVYPVMGVGHVMTYETRPDGTSYVFLVGEARVRVVDWESRTRHFRRASLEALDEVAVPVAKRRRALERRLSKWLERLTRSSGKNEDFLALQKVVGKEKDAGFLTDFLAHHFIEEVEERQRLLEEVEVERRAEALCASLEARWGS